MVARGLAPVNLPLLKVDGLVRRANFHALTYLVTRQGAAARRGASNQRRCLRSSEQKKERRCRQRQRAAKATRHA